MWKVAPQSIVKSSKSWRVFIILTWLLHLIIFNIHLGPSWFWHMSQALHWQLQWNPRASKAHKMATFFAEGRAKKLCFGCYLMLSAIFTRDESFTAILDDLEKTKQLAHWPLVLLKKAMTGNDQWSLKPCFFFVPIQEGWSPHPLTCIPRPLWQPFGFEITLNGFRFKWIFDLKPVDLQTKHRATKLTKQAIWITKRNAT